MFFRDYGSISARAHTINEPNSKTKGDLTESKVIHELISRGCRVSIPFGDNDKYDLMVETPEGNIFRIQCKTAWRTAVDTVRFNTHSQTTREGEYHQSNYFGEIDAFLVWFPDRKQLYWVDIDHANESKMDLRYDADIDHPAINWAPDFELGDEIPPRDP